MNIGVLKGNGIGPEITAATLHVLEATGLPFTWEDIPVAEEAQAKYGHPFPPEVVGRIKELKAAIKAPLIVNKLQGRLTCRQPDGTEMVYPSLNNAIRRELRLFANARPIRGYVGVSDKYHVLDTVIMREVTEDVYFGQEHRIGDIAAEAVKLITREASERIARYSFEFARANGRKRVTCLHKANVLNFTDGLFLRCFREVAADYPELVADDLMIDAACYTIIKQPERFDVVTAPNQYGDIFSDLAAGLVGSLGLAPGANIGLDAATFEASHGAAPDIAGKGIANPAALILSGALMLRHLNFPAQAKAVEEAVRLQIESREELTPDLGGKGSTMGFAQAVAARVKTLVK